MTSVRQTPGLALVIGLALLCWTLMDDTTIFRSTGEPASVVRRNATRHFSQRATFSNLSKEEDVPKTTHTVEQEAMDEIKSETTSSCPSYTVVIRVGGEMGNFLSRIAYGYGLSWILEEDYNITTHILFEYEHNNRWTSAEASLQRCFPNVRRFERVSTRAVEEQAANQEKLLGHEDHNMLATTLNDCQDEHCIRRRMEAFKRIISKISITSWNSTSRVSLPFIVACTFGSLGYINDRFYARLQNLFQFDESVCCSERSPGNETVFHVRGFTTEIKRRGVQLGMEEASPNKTAHELLRLDRNASSGHKVAVLGRYQAQDHVDAIRAAGFDARFVETETGEESFCYLLSARDDLVGTAMSTFLVWASYLGNATRVRLYSIKSPARIKYFGNDKYFFQYDFKNPFLKKKISFEVINSEEQDMLDVEQKLETFL